MYMDFFNSLIFSPGFLLFVGITILLFLIFREIVTWYWKQNEIVDLLKKIEANTRKDSGGELASASANDRKPEQWAGREAAVFLRNFSGKHRKVLSTLLIVLLFVIAIAVIFFTSSGKAFMQLIY